jgi:hypothetical protein
MRFRQREGRVRIKGLKKSGGDGEPVVQDGKASHCGNLVLEMVVCMAAHAGGGYFCLASMDCQKKHGPHLHRL